jgi:hypothetical protein
LPYNYNNHNYNNHNYDDLGSMFWIINMVMDTVNKLVGCYQQFLSKWLRTDPAYVLRFFFLSGHHYWMFLLSWAWANRLHYANLNNAQPFSNNNNAGTFGWMHRLMCMGSDL